MYNLELQDAQGRGVEFQAIRRQFKCRMLLIQSGACRKFVRNTGKHSGI